jgi:hypothetical protein
METHINITEIKTTHFLSFFKSCTSFKGKVIKPINNYFSGFNKAILKKVIATVLVAGIIFSVFFPLKNYISSFHSKKIELLCVLYDAGETGGLLPVLKELEIQGVDFRVLLMGTAETLVKPEQFANKRITLKDLGIETTIDTTTSRTTALSKKMMAKFNVFKPKVVLVGTASKIQQQVLEQYSSAKTIAFVDNFSYDKKQESFQTVDKVQAAAKEVLCPSQHTMELLNQETENSKKQPVYHVVGKPTLEVWQQEISSINKAEVLEKLNFNDIKPVVTFIGGYGPGYDVINPLFKSCTQLLESEGFHVIQQPHPKVAPQKVKTTEALAISQYVIGYNSSVVLDSAIIGKSSLFFIPDNPETQFQHFAIDDGLISKVSTSEELLQHLKAKNQSLQIRETLGVPQNSTQIITQLIEKRIKSD